ncbi:AbrB family transcriptional regulator [Brucella sp. BE17]|uniref:AbrB family transcriptional regulator n=1 Tax=Brucella sp. BE17 TaxID=3142977 RepID=UPI0031BA8A5B
MQLPPPSKPGSDISGLNFGKLPRSIQWGVLFILSAVLIFTGEILSLPGALLVGAMVGGILLATGEATIRVHNWLSLGAQAVIGCLIARAITVEFFINMGQHLPVILISMIYVLLVSTLIGYLLAYFRIIPGTTAVWGTSAGAASAMTLMAESFGADARLVAFMQYLRVVLVVSVASLVVRFNMETSTLENVAMIWFPPINPPSLAATLLLIMGGAIIGQISRIPTGAMLVPLALGVLLQDTGVMTIDLPPWLLAASYALIGWRIGLGFSRAILAYAAKAFPAVLLSILLMIAVCGLFGMVLSFTLGLDPLTAYLATSPGGADTVAIIAASSNVDLPFIIAMQTSRFFVVLLAGPTIARFIAHRLNKQGK